MLLPAMGFFFMLIIFGGIGSLVAAFDPHAAVKPSAPFAFAALFSGLAAYGSLFLAVPAEILLNPSFGGFVFVVGLVGGSIGGALYGYRVGVRRSRRAETELCFKEQEAEEGL